MKLLLALALVVAVALTSAPAAACDCPVFEDDGALARHAVAFEGWVIEAPQPWRCPLPAAPRSRPGCVRIAVVNRQDCTLDAALLDLQASDGRHYTPTSLDAGVATFCGVPAGPARLTGSPVWIGQGDQEIGDNGTLDHGRALDLAPGGSYVVFDQGRAGQRLRVGVARALKGQVAREVVVNAENDCGTSYFEVGHAWRFFGELDAAGAVVIRGCSSSRPLTRQERAALVAAPASELPAAPTAGPASTSPGPASAPVVPSRARSGSCSTTPSAAWPALGVLLLGWRRRRQRAGSAAAGSSRPRSAASDRGAGALR